MSRLRLRHARGFSLIEVAISTAIVGTMVVAALQAVAVARVRLVQVNDHARGMMLAQDLMTEILSQAYEEPGGGTTLGRETGETATSRTAYDDVDDYAGFTENPPKRKDGTALSDGTNWSRSVTVVYSNPTTLAGIAVAAAGTDTGLKLITVSVAHNNVTVAVLSALRSVAWTPTLDGSGATGISGLLDTPLTAIGVLQ
jgi:prepilin-type N-terminal cleavage/methylation domain-containing protein